MTPRKLMISRQNNSKLKLEVLRRKMLRRIA
jgi:hypothetical protein